jgi:DNA-binding beta-propeller fold protein YncE
VVALYGDGAKPLHSVASTVVEGGIHRFLSVWVLPAGFLPTRVLVSPHGAVCVVGAGSGRVARFDRAGHGLEAWDFAPGPPACLETGALDAAVMALDSQGSLYVAYNRPKPDQAPRPYWSKFDAEGKLVWARPLEGLFVRHLAIDPRDHIYVESLSQIQEFDTTGRRLAEHRVPPLLVASLRFWGDHFAALVEPLAFAESGWQAPRLVIYGDAGRTSAEQVIGRDPLSPEDRAHGVLVRPCDFAVDEGTDRAFVVNAGRSRVDVFRQGAYLTGWGTEGGGDGAFRFAGRVAVVADMATGRTEERPVVAGGIACDAEGYVYVADPFNDRVQKFRP